jgi:hypothetical protein
VKVVAVTAWVLVVSALTVAPTIQTPAGGLDQSWQAGLDLLNRLHLHGARPLFTYGPYGFLNVRVPFFVREWMLGSFTSLAVHVALVALIAVLMLRRRAPWLTWAVIAVPLVLALYAVYYLDIEISMLAGVLAYLTTDVSDPRWRQALAVVTGALLAVVLLVKVTSIVVVGGLLVVVVGATLLMRRYLTLASLLASFLLVFAALWSSAGLGFGDVGRYLRSAVELGAGYAGAMYFGGASVALVVGGILLVGLVLLTVVAAMLRQWPRVVWFLVALVVLFAFFKDAIVRVGTDRDDMFLVTAAVMGTITLAAAGLVTDLRVRSRRAIGFGVVGAGVIAAAWIGGSPGPFSQLDSRWHGYATLAHAVVDGSVRHRLQDDALHTMQSSEAPLLAKLSLPPGATVDVMPWDISLVYADATLNWDPRPILQSYTAYTPWLEGLDAQFLASPRAPDYIVYTYATVDDRYALFDEPSTFRTLLRHYRVVRALDAQTLLLQRAGSPGGADAGVRDEGRVCGAYGQALAVPHVAGRWVFAALDVHQTLAGRVVALLAKPAEVRITLRAGGVDHDFRLVAPVAADGIYLSSFAGDSTSVAAIFDGNSPAPPVSSFTVTTSVHREWQAPVCATFWSEAPARG